VVLVFKPDGVVTAAGSSGICDGAASLVVASEASCKANGYQPLARIVGWSRVGCEPTEMGIGPVPAILSVLEVTGVALQDVDLIEINEAFAAQFLACEKALGFDRSKANLNGGAIALGHPLGASGARILTHLSHELKRTGKRYGIGAACIGTIFLTILFEIKSDTIDVALYQGGDKELQFCWKMLPHKFWLRFIVFNCF
jgi:acetyl-CoA acyltransferase 2